MDAPQRPHALREMRVEMAVKDRIPHRAVAVPRALTVPPAALALAIRAALAAVIDVIGKALLRRDRLAVQIRAPVGVVARKPLMRMQVKDMGFLGAGMEVAKHHRVVQIGMMHVRGIVRIPFQKRRIAIRP